MPPAHLPHHGRLRKTGSAWLASIFQISVRTAVDLPIAPLVLLKGDHDFQRIGFPRYLPAARRRNSLSAKPNLEPGEHIQNHRVIGCKRPLRSSSPTTQPTPLFLLNHVLKCHIYTFFKHLQGWGLHHLPGQPVPMPDCSFSKEIFPDIYSKTPLMQLEAIASHPIASYLGEETNTPLTTPSFQGVVESEKVPPQPPLLQTKEPQSLQPLFIRLIL